VWTMGGPRSISVQELAEAVETAARAKGVTAVFIATDGRFRDGAHLVEELKARLERRGLVPKELKDLPGGHYAGSAGGESRLGLRQATFESELEQQVVALSSFALGSSRSSWYFEALFEMTARHQRDVRGFEVVVETEAAFHAMSPSLHEGVPFPVATAGRMDGLTFGFLKEDEGGPIDAKEKGIANKVNSQGVQVREQDRKRTKMKKKKRSTQA